MTVTCIFRSFSLFSLRSSQYRNKSPTTNQINVQKKNETFFFIPNNKRQQKKANKFLTVFHHHNGHCIRLVSGDEDEIFKLNSDYTLHFGKLILFSSEPKCCLYQFILLCRSAFIGYVLLKTKLSRNAVVCMYMRRCVRLYRRPITSSFAGIKS